MLRQLLDLVRTAGKPASGVPAKPRRRRLMLQRLNQRELLASDLGVITGTVYTDLAGDDTINSIVNTSGATVNDPVLENVDVTLYNDVDGDGALTGADGAAIATVQSGADGVFRFEGLSPGDYLLVQSAVAGLISNTDPVPVEVVDDDGESVQLIDEFTAGMNELSLDDQAAPVAIGTATDTGILGDNRVVILDNVDDDGGQEVNVEVDAGNQRLQFNSNQQAELAVRVQYDGDTDGASPLNFSGLGGVDLVQGNLGAGLLLSSRADQANGEVIVRIYTDANQASETTLQIANQATFEELFVPFSTFTQLGANGPADFTDVGAIEFEIDGVAGLDGAVSVIGSIAPVEVTQNLANYEPLSLGNLVFQDDNNNGVRDPGEAGLENVAMTLYEDDGDGVFEPGTADTVVTSTTSGVGGAYSFTNLRPGDYFVQIDDTNFNNGEPLFGYVSSTGNDPAPDPDADATDNDDNGTDVAGQGIVSQAITLVSQGEPIDDGDTDPSTNFTVDFGVVPVTDLQVEKELLATDPAAGQEIRFRITVTNNGDLEATNITVTDTLPSGLTPIGVENASPGFNAPDISGSDVEVTADTLAVGDSLQFDIVAEIAASTTDPLIVNEANVTADQGDTIVDNNSDQAEVPVAIVTDLRLDKSAPTATVDGGSNLTYTIVVTNDGPSDATGVVVTDTLPAGLTFVSGDVDGDASGVTTDANGVVTATIGDLADEASQTITLVVAVASDAPDQIDNSATVSNTPDTDQNPDNDTDNAIVDVLRQVDVGITKTVSANPTAGEDATFTFTVENTGTVDARGVTVTDTLDDLFSFVSFDPGTSGAELNRNDQQLTFDLGTVAGGATATFTVDVGLGASLADSTSIPNTAAVTTSDNDTNPDNDSSTIDVVVGRTVDLTVDKTANLTTAVPGQPIVYTLTARNDGPSDASGVRIIDTLPSQPFTVTSVDAGDATFVNTNGQLTFTLGDLAAGTEQSVTVTGTIDASATGTLTNTAEVEGNENEDTTNNQAELSTPLSPQFDVTVTKSADAEATPGSNLTYTIEVTNIAGPSDATNVQLTDTLPAGVQFVSGSLNGQAATANGNQVTFPAITLSPGSSSTANLTVAIDDAASGTLTNTIDVTSDPGDVPGNNSSSVNTLLVPDVNLTVEKTVSSDSAQRGDQLTYTITVTNEGTSAAADVTASDLLPAGVDFVSGSAPDGTPLTANGQDVPVTIGDLAGDESATFTIVAAVNETASGTLQNSVSVATATTELNPDDNTATAGTTVDLVSASIRGTSFIDTNNNGQQDAGEQGIPGVTMILNGDADNGETVTRETTTDENGAYEFLSLPAGNYEVTERQPARFADGLEDAGQVAGEDSGATTSPDAGSNSISNLTVGPGQSVRSVSFGNLDVPFSKYRYLTPLP